MALTNFPNGISSMGVPIVGGMPPSIFGRYWFVDAKNGSDGNSGKSASRPFLTMAKAFAVIDSGDVIMFRGKVREQLTTPEGVFDVTIIGACTRPRHADDHSEDSSPGRGSSSATWMAPASPTALTPNLKIIMQGWRLCNFLMASATTSSAGVQLAANSESGDDEYNAGHAWFQGMRFDANPLGIQSMSVGFVGVENCYFRGHTTTAISSTAGGGGTTSFWEIRGNRFTDNVNHIVVPLGQSDIVGNVMGKFTTKAIDLSGSGIGANAVHGNYLSGDYTTAAYVAASGDSWAGNYSMDSETEIGDNGITIAVPAS